MVINNHTTEPKTARQRAGERPAWSPARLACSACCRVTCLDACDSRTKWDERKAWCFFPHQSFQNRWVCMCVRWGSSCAFDHNHHLRSGPSHGQRGLVGYSLCQDVHTSPKQGEIPPTLLFLSLVIVFFPQLNSTETSAIPGPLPAFGLKLYY